MSAHDKFFWQMFIFFLQTQASVQAPQAPSINLEHIKNLEVFIGEGSSIKQIYQYF